MILPIAHFEFSSKMEKLALLAWPKWNHYYLMGGMDD